MGAKIPTAKSNNGKHIQKREGCIVHRFEMKCVSYWCKPQLIPQNNIYIKYIYVYLSPCYIA